MLNFDQRLVMDDVDTIARQRDFDATILACVESLELTVKGCFHNGDPQ